MELKFLIWGIKDKVAEKVQILRTFARKTSRTQIFFILWLQSDNELPMSEMQINWGHRLRFRNKARGKLLQF